MVSSWWRWVKIRWTIDKYLYHAHQEDEWLNRYVVDDKLTEATQQKAVHTHRMKKHTAMDYLAFVYNFPQNMWIRIGDGREAYFRTGREPEEEDEVLVRWRRSS